METKYVTIPFDLERAKRITNGEEEGKIVTRDGQDVRILCFDKKGDYPIVSLIYVCETHETIMQNGIDGKDNPFEKKESDLDLLLSVPEWTNFKIGDILCSDTGAFIYNGNYDKKRHSYGAYCGVNSIGQLNIIGDHILEDDNSSWTSSEVRYATDREKNVLIQLLKESKYELSEYYLKYFLHIQKEYNFEPKQWVLTRDSAEDVWKLDIFSHTEYDETENCYHYHCVGGWYYECIPYNLETKDLLGTTENWDK